MLTNLNLWDSFKLITSNSCQANKNYVTTNQFKDYKSEGKQKIEIEESQSEIRKSKDLIIEIENKTIN